MAALGGSHLTWKGTLNNSVEGEGVGAGSALDLAGGACCLGAPGQLALGPQSGADLHSRGLAGDRGAVDVGGEDDWECSGARAKKREEVGRIGIATSGNNGGVGDKPITPVVVRAVQITHGLHHDHLGGLNRQDGGDCLGAGCGG